MFLGIYKLFLLQKMLGRETDLRVKSITQREGGADVVAVRTKGGWYKTKAGMSHNCDDM